MWDVEGTDEFALWYHARTDEEREAIKAAITLLEARGPSLSTHA